MMYWAVILINIPIRTLKLIIKALINLRFEKIFSPDSWKKDSLIQTIKQVKNILWMMMPSLPLVNFSKLLTGLTSLKFLLISTPSSKTLRANSMKIVRDGSNMRGPKPLWEAYWVRLTDSWLPQVPSLTSLHVVELTKSISEFYFVLYPSLFLLFPFLKINY